MATHSLTKDEPNFNSVYSRNNLPKTKDGEYVINLDEYESVGTHWKALFVNGDVKYFDSFGAEHIPKEIKKLNNKNITKIILTIQAWLSLMCPSFVLDLMISS